MRRLTPEERPAEESEVSRNPENEGAVGGAPRPRDNDNSLSFRHFLQPHSDVVPQPPPPTRNRTSRGSHPGGVDLVDVTMALPDFVQDHLIMESIASGEHDLSPSRQHAGHPLDLNVLNEILPEFASSQQNSRRNSQGSSRRSGLEPSTNADNNPINQNSSALPDFLSDGPMQLNNSDSNNLVNIPTPSSSSTSRGNRCNRPQLENILTEEPVRGPSFESNNNNLRLEVERLRSELAEKNRRVNQMETELTRQRAASSNLESSLRTTERHLTEAIKRASDAENQIMDLLNGRIENGHGDHRSNSSHSCEQSGVDSSRIFSIASSSENLISQLVSQMEELKRLALHANGQSHAGGSTKEQKKSKH